MSWLFSRALVADFENWPSSPGRVEAYSPGTCSDGGQSVPWSVMPTPHAFWQSAKTKAFSRPSQYGRTWRRLTAEHGAALLMWFLAGSRARTSPPQGRGQGWPVHGPDCGSTNCGLSARLSQNGCLSKTPISSSEEASPRFRQGYRKRVTLTPWVCCPPATAARGTDATGAGSLGEGLRTLTVSVAHGQSGAGKVKRGGSIKLSDQVMLPTLSATDVKGRSGAGHIVKHGMKRLSDALLPTLTASMVTPGDMEQAAHHSSTRPEYRSGGGRLNPEWCEWFMGWPMGWTELKPLETGKFQGWRRQHSLFYPNN